VLQVSRCGRAIHVKFEALADANLDEVVDLLSV
jgi:hypothetical protein